MTVALGIFKQLRFKRETNFGTAAGTGTGFLLRRVTSDVDLSKDTYQSNEIISTQQLQTFVHGARKVQGNVNGELSPGTYQQFIQAFLRRVHTSVTNITTAAQTLQVAASGSYWTVTISGGAVTWFTGGVKIGMVVRITAGLANAANINKNLFVLNATSTVLTVVPLNGSAMAAEGPTGTCTVTIPGQVTYVPSTGHVNQSFSIEHYYSDLVQSELFTGCRVGSMQLSLPPTGIATGQFGVMGQNITTASAEYFATGSLTAVTTSGGMSSVNGVLTTAAGSALGTVTGLTINGDGGMGTYQVVGSNITPDISVGRVRVSGQLTALFDSVTLRDAFLNESQVGVAFAMASDGSNTSKFMSFALPYCKIGGATKNDGEGGLVLTCPFQALYNGSGGSGTATEQTTLWTQDSDATTIA